MLKDKTPKHTKDHKYQTNDIAKGAYTMDFVCMYVFVLWRGETQFRNISTPAEAQHSKQRTKTNQRNGREEKMMTPRN